MDLATKIGDRLVLRDPFIIASSHWTANENSLRAFRPFSPSAVTLKTTSQSKGGDGAMAFERRRKLPLEDSFGNEFAFFTDGAKTLELLDVAASYKLTEIARQVLPETIIGLSVLQGEAYGEIASALNLDSYGYIELNMKYSFRSVAMDKLSKFLTEFLHDVEQFLEAFKSRPVLVKFSREATPLLRMNALDELLGIISHAGGAVVIANSLRTRVPPSRTGSQQLAELNSGVLIGEHLLLDTYDLIRLLSAMRSEGSNVPPIVASGGIVDIGGVIDVLAAGAAAVQLCSAFDLRGPHMLPLLRAQLDRVASEYGSLNEFIGAMITDPSAWHDAAVEARHLRVLPAESVNRLLNNDDLIAPELAAAFAAEHSLAAEHGQVDPTILKDTKLAFTKGNVSTFLIGRYCSERGLYSGQVFESAANFCSDLGTGRLTWDLALLPESALEYLRRQGGELLGDQNPEVVRQIGNSVFELVGAGGLDLRSVEKVYHFGGNSSRAALGTLLREIHPETQQINREELFALLASWHARSAILAKAPLSRFYGHFCDAEAAKSWARIWSTAEPLHLVASRRFMRQGNSKEVCHATLIAVSQAARELAESPERLLRYARGEGLLKYFAELLAG